MSTISEQDAVAQTEAVKKIMAEQGLDFGPAYDEYIRQQQVVEQQVDMSGWDAA